MANKLHKQLAEARQPAPRRSPNVKMVTFGMPIDTFGRLRAMAQHLNRPYQELMRELIAIGLWTLEEREAGRYPQIKAREAATAALAQRPDEEGAATRNRAAPKR